MTSPSCKIKVIKARDFLCIKQGKCEVIEKKLHRVRVTCDVEQFQV